MSWGKVVLTEDLPGGHRITVTRKDDGGLLVRGSGSGLGKLSIEPGGANEFIVRVIA